MGFWERDLDEIVSVDDGSWGRVESINRYAVLMGYLSMAIKGLGFLVLTWTTVVLLGGFVSTLHKSDFWSLTFITLVQTAGVFDVVLNEKLSYVLRAIGGLLERVFLGVRGSRDTILLSSARLLLACTVVLVLVLVLAVILCPLAVIYVFGILMSGGISVWRLKEHGYRGSDGEASNLPAAMDTLYYLAVIQCVLFCYKYVLGRTGKRLANGTASTCDYLEKEVLSRYLSETKKGCEKDPSFAEGRDLSTHAIHMINSKSHIDCISGVKMLYTSICIMERRRSTCKEMKQFIRAATSSRKVLQKLLEMLDTIDQEDRETTKQAAKIVECLASNINLELFPHGIHYISLLIGTLQESSASERFQKYCNIRAKVVQDYKELLLRGLRIIWELSSSENNCKVIRDTQGMVSKIMAPVNSDLLHHASDDHGEWSDIVEASVHVMGRLIRAPGETGVKLRRDISIDEKAVRSLMTIIRCNVCNKELQTIAIQILADLYMDTTEDGKAAHFFHLKKEFVRMVLDIFTDGNKSLHIRWSAGHALSFFRGESNATIVMQTSADVVKRLARVLLAEKYLVFITQAAVILQHLWTFYTEDDYLSVLKTEMSIVAGQVIIGITDAGKHALAYPQADIETQRDNGPAKGIVSFPSSSYAQNNDQDEKEKVREEIIRREDETHTGVTKPETDIENQNDSSLDKGITPSSSSSHPKNEGQDKNEDLRATMLSSLLSLCGMVYDKFVSEGSDLTPQFDNASIFLNMLNKIVVEKFERRTVESLSLLKAIAKMVISMMKDSTGRFVVEEREGLQSLIEALSRASKNMLDLDHSMIFSSTSSFEPTVELDKCTLASLVKEAQEWYARSPSTSGSG